MKKRAVVLVSGGLDSATCLAIAKAEGYDCYALSFDYGQRHRVELEAAARVAASVGVVEQKTVSIDLGGIGGSALTDEGIAVPKASEDRQEAIPLTYVPARNTLFLSVALGWAEVLGAEAIFIGVNAVDYSGYPDCRPEFIAAFQQMADLGTKRGVEAIEAGERSPIVIKSPLMDLSKVGIIQRGVALGVDYGLTVSCYQVRGDGAACGECDSCHFRREGFAGAGVDDPTLYVD